MDAFAVGAGYTKNVVGMNDQDKDELNTAEGLKQGLSKLW